MLILDPLADASPENAHAGADPLTGFPQVKFC